MERTTLHSVEPSAEESGEAVAGPETARGRGAGRTPTRKPRDSAKADVKGRTIYLPETLFERIMVQAHRKRKTISEYVTGILDRQVPDYRTPARPEADDAA